MAGILTDKPISDFRVLLVNDDGIDAKGFAVLEEFARQKFGEVFVAAPAHEHSAKARSITFHRTFDVERRGENRYAVDGTPTDCVIFGLHHIFQGSRPDLVLSGVNHGENVGHAITYSGTFGAAFEAGLHNIPAISFSQLLNDKTNPDFSIARDHMWLACEEIFSKEWPAHTVMNVNFPTYLHSQVARCHWVPVEQQSIIEKIKVDHDGTDRMKVQTQFRRDYSPHSHEQVTDDLDVIRRGGIAVTPVMTNWTCHTSLKKIMGDV